MKPASTSSAATLKLTVRELMAATGARRVSGEPRELLLRGVTTDGRAVPSGGLFIALSGERFDGADFAPQAVSAGASAVLVNASRAAQVAQACPDATVLSVDSTLRALSMLARWHRERMPARVVAVTGSNGKTTTKELVRFALSTSGPTHATLGNLNNEIGAPLSLLGLRSEHRFAVFELGMNHEGEIARLTAMTRPDVGVVTNVAAVHVEGLGSLDGVSRAKGELFHGLPLDGVAVANADDPLVAARAEWASRRTLWFGEAVRSDVRLERILSHDARGLRMEVRAFGRSLPVTLPLVGLHNGVNACAALAAAAACGVELEVAAEGLSKARLPGRRLLLKPIPGTDATLLDDCYNANPASTLAALATLRELAPEGSRIAVLGDMRELGPDEARAHREVGAAAAGSGLSLLVAFGPVSRALAEGALAAGFPAERVLHTDDPDAAARRVREFLETGATRAGTLVLVKASRGTRLERVSDRLAPADTENPDGAGEAP